MSAFGQKRTPKLFLIAFSLRFDHLRNALVIVSDAPHDCFGVLVLKVLGDVENFLGAKTPTVWVFEVGGHRRS
jgi:hypothetical protein